MANNNIEQYLEAMLAVLNGDNPPDVPTPSWNIEKYLAAILGKLEELVNGGGMPVIRDVDETLDHTWKEISEMPTAVLYLPADSYPRYYLAWTNHVTLGQNHIYMVIFSFYSLDDEDHPVAYTTYTTNSEDGYPELA